MDALYLVKIGEITLKDGNRQEFVDTLKRDVKRRLSSAGIKNSFGSRDARYYLTVPESGRAAAEHILSRVPGINGWARAEKVAKDIDAIAATAVELMRERAAAGARSFKVEARRTDKGFPLDSYGIARELGDRILAAVPGLPVNVRDPGTTLYVEIREAAYLYTDGEPGVRGLPVGSTGAGLLLLSGGIDSPVAGYRMLGRGLALESLHFSAYPYTSREAWEKVRSLAEVLAGYAGGMVLHTMSFTEFQLRLKKDAPADRTTLYLRAAMMIAAAALARKRCLNSIVTGESLGQVASQTAENMRFTGSYTDLPILRPLVGTDKEDTIRTARAIGSYEISIQPYEDCCVLFSPRHPVLRACFERERADFEALGLGDELRAAVAATETVELPCPLTPPA